MGFCQSNKLLFFDILVIVSKECFVVEELKTNLWSFGGHDMALTRQMRSFSDPVKILFWSCGCDSAEPRFSMGKMKRVIKHNVTILWSGS